jgi:peptidoglycan/LPS O-acetylase OafA/YrhL
VTPVTRTARTLLRVAAAVVSVEALVCLTGAVIELGDASGDLKAFDVAAGVVLIVLGAGLLMAAWQVRRGRRWARAPLIVTQLIQLLLATDVRPEGLGWVAPTMVVSSLVVLVCLLAPPVTRALRNERPV